MSFNVNALLSSYRDFVLGPSFATKVCPSHVHLKLEFSCMKDENMGSRQLMLQCNLMQHPKCKLIMLNQYSTQKLGFAGAQALLANVVYHTSSRSFFQKLVFLNRFINEITGVVRRNPELIRLLNATSSFKENLALFLVGHLPLDAI